MFRIAGSLLVFLLVSLSLIAKETTLSDQMVRDLDVIRASFQAKYAPGEWKEEKFGWDLDAEVERAKVDVYQLKNPSVKEYQKIVKNFFNRTNDYHTDVHFVSTEMSFVPVRFQRAQGRCFIAAVERDELPSGAERLQVGDEVLEVDGVSVQDALDIFSSEEFKSKKSATDQALVEHLFTYRLGTSASDIPKGSLSLKVRHKNSKDIKTYTIPWEYYPELIRGRRALAAEDGWPKLPEKNVSAHPFFHRKMSTPFYDRHLAAKKWIDFRRNSHDVEDDDWVHDMVGYVKSRLPRLGKPIWNGAGCEYFDAYIYQTPSKKKVGFVRIPTFFPDECKAAAKEFSNLINFYESYTDLLVIDQQGNPGGDLFYMYALLSCLCDKSFELPSQREAITQMDALFFLELLDFFSLLQQNRDLIDLDSCLGDDFSGFPVGESFVDGVCSYTTFMLSEWNAGHHFTSPSHLYGIERLHPNPNGFYTKPILVLVDSVDFSCGDFFPAVLQDNNRATIMGQRTAGAGGYVIGSRHHNLFGVAAYTLTGSIAERINGQKIENEGVTPDIPYKVTANDLENNFKDFSKAVKEAIEKL